MATPRAPASCRHFGAAVCLLLAHTATAIVGGSSAGGRLTDSEALVQARAIVERSPAKPISVEQFVAGLEHDELPRSRAKSITEMESVEDILAVFADVKKIQESLARNSSRGKSTNQELPKATVKSASEQAADADESLFDNAVDFSLFLDKEFTLGNFVKVSAKWGIELVTGNCTLEVNLRPKLAVAVSVKGPVLTVEDGMKIDWMPPVYFIGSPYDLELESTIDDEIQIHGMCTEVKVLEASVQVCLDWRLANKGGCDFNLWEVSARGLFIAHENLPFPFQGLIPTVPTPEVSVGTLSLPTR